MKNKLLAGAMALALIGCSQNPAEKAGSDAANVAAEESAADSPPDIAIAAAPGVAFDYSYSFRIDDDRISALQQQHAEACEMLGTSRCRVVDVRYALSDSKDVSASTMFKIDPGIARRFGVDAIVSVEKAEGVLAEASVQGEDVGSQIVSSQQRSAGNDAEIARVEERLKQGGLNKIERAELLEQISALRVQNQDNFAARRTGEARIAAISVAFNYTGTGGIAGIGNENPFNAAGATFMRSGGTALTMILTVGAAILPWALMLGLALLVWRRARAYWTPVRRPSGEVAATE